MRVKTVHGKIIYKASKSPVKGPKTLTPPILDSQPKRKIKFRKPGTVALREIKKY